MGAPKTIWATHSASRFAPVRAAILALIMAAQTSVLRDKTGFEILSFLASDTASRVTPLANWTLL